MKTLCNILALLFGAYVNGNILLQKPQLVDAVELQQLVENWETEFTWCFGKGCNFTCCYKQGKASFLVQALGVPVRSYNFDYGIFAKKCSSYFFEKNPSYYFAQPLDNPKVSPQEIVPGKLVDFLRTKRCLFYTGAGLSAASGVATMSSLEKSLSLSEGLVSFLRQIYWRPQEIVRGFKEFCETAILSEPTPAHHALHTITQKQGIALLTENVDLLQQRAGSKPLSPHLEDVGAVTQQNLLEIDAIICVGLSHDDCGFLAHYKKNNPAGILVAIDKGTPSYLSDHDFIIQDDLQKVLPYIAKTIEG